MTKCLLTYVYKTYKTLRIGFNELRGLFDYPFKHRFITSFYVVLRNKYYKF